MMTDATDRSDLDVSKLQAEIGEVMAKYRTVALAEMQIGPILQEMSQIALRHRLPLPASLTLSAKALAQVQLATADLDPQLDPFEVAGKFLVRSTLPALDGAQHGHFDHVGHGCHHQAHHPSLDTPKNRPLRNFAHDVNSE
jgi:ubiquinone biosynthesis protein